MGLGFFPPFIAARKSDFFVLSFSKRRQSRVLAKVAVFLGTSFLWDSGVVVSTRSLCTLLLAVQSFLVTRSVGLFGSFLATYVLNCLERQKEQTHVHRSPTFLVKVELILPRVQARL